VRHITVFSRSQFRELDGSSPNVESKNDHEVIKNLHSLSLISPLWTEAGYFSRDWTKNLSISRKDEIHEFISTLFNCLKQLWSHGHVFWNDESIAMMMFIILRNCPSALCISQWSALVDVDDIVQRIDKVGTWFSSQDRTFWFFSSISAHLFSQSFV
jgi:hypothetical protein